MPIVGGGMEQTLALLLQLSQQNQQRRMQQTGNLLNMAKPGQTLSELGITPRMFGQLTGRRDVDPGSFVPVELTPDVVIARERLTMIDRMTPEQRQTLAASMQAKELGIPQATTTQGLMDIAAANTNMAAAARTRSATIADLVNEGAEAWKQAKPEVRAAAGMAAVSGTTASAVEAEELANNLKSEMTREALKFAVDPQNHAFGVLLRQRLKIDPVAAMAAVGSGMSQMIHDLAQAHLQAGLQGQQRESAIQIELARSAGELAKATGFRINPLDVTAVWNARMRGINPANTPGLREVSQLMDATAEINFRAAVSEAMKKSDPQLETVNQMMLLLRSSADPNTIAQASKLLQASAGRVQQTYTVGPRPVVDPSATGSERQAQLIRQRKWDDQAAALGAMSFGIFNKTRNLWFDPGLQAQGAGVPTDTRPMELPGAAPNPGLGRPQGSIFNQPTGTRPPAPTPAPTTRDIPSGTPPDVEQSMKDFMQAYMQAGQIMIPVTPP